MEHEGGAASGSESGGAGSEEDALRRLEERLARASDAAERLMAEAKEQAGAAKPPPAGWQTPRQARAESDIELITQILASLRELIPAELERRLAHALRELLLAIRALIDWYLERSERGRAEPTEVKDIPIL